jgi:hypothetical protein
MQLEVTGGIDNRFGEPPAEDLSDACLATISATYA